MARQIRVLVVDDSPLIRQLLCDALATQADMQVVGTAVDGVHALEMIEKLRPDVVTLDVQMPRLGGLETLDQILDRRPTPVIVVSALSRRAADVTMQALDRGAMDYVAKPSGSAELRQLFQEELPQKIRNVAGTDVRRVLQYRKSRALRATAASRQAGAPDKTLLAHCSAGCIAIGVSTGGPPALSSLFGSFVPPLPPIIVVQHMPQLFTGPFAERLNSLSLLDVKEAQTGDKLRPNLALIAPGGQHLSLVRRGTQVEVRIEDGDPVSGHKPSADVMMQSAARLYGSRCLGVIMTGMGRDGADGCGAIRAAGGYVIGQDAATSDIYGMNRVAFVEGHVNLQVPLQELADSIAKHAIGACRGERGKNDSRAFNVSTRKFATMKYSPIRVEFVNPFVESVYSVFATMLGLEVRRGQLSLKDGLQPQYEVSGIIGLSGLAKGTVVLSMSQPLAIEITSILLGDRCPAITADVVDTIGEVANMIAGGAKAKLEDLKMSMSLPTVITGRNHVIAFPSGVTPLCISFDSPHGPFCLEVGLATIG